MNTKNTNVSLSSRGLVTDERLAEMLRMAEEFRDFSEQHGVRNPELYDRVHTLRELQTLRLRCERLEEALRAVIDQEGGYVTDSKEDFETRMHDMGDIARAALSQRAGDQQEKTT